jgi:hypothetical protein
MIKTLKELILKIVYNSSGEYPDVINTNYQLERWPFNSTENALFVGYATSIDEELKKQYASYLKRAYINLEAPCAFFTRDDAVTSQNFFNEVYTICPYTAEWLNKWGQAHTKYWPIAFPYNMEMMKNYGSINKENKCYDVIYLGHLAAPIHQRMIEVVKNYNYRFCSIFPGPLVTNHNIPIRDKWNLLSQSKISVAINLLHPDAGHRGRVKSYDKWSLNLAFAHIDSGEVPQFKPRIIEAAVCKTLNLVMYDRWNVIEKWFTPDKEFIYWYNIEDLRKKIDDIKNNYTKYWRVVENAYARVQEYTIEGLIKHIMSKMTYGPFNNIG